MRTDRVFVVATAAVLLAALVAGCGSNESVTFEKQTLRFTEKQNDDSSERKNRTALTTSCSRGQS